MLFEAQQILAIYREKIIKRNCVKRGRVRKQLSINKKAPFVLTLHSHIHTTLISMQGQVLSPQLLHMFNSFIQESYYYLPTHLVYLASL